MNNFFKTFFACLLAIVVGSMGVFIFSFIILAGVISMIGSMGKGSDQMAITPKPHTVLRIDLSQPFPDKPNGNAFELFDYSDFSFREQTTLLDAVTLIDGAAADPNIDGIYLNIPMMIPSSVSTLYELRQALAEFRESGKFVVSYADVYSQGGYYLASVGDRIYLNPQGGVAWTGLSANVLFYKGALDKLGVTAELIRHGEFKGAAEPFVLDKLSDENRLQMASMTGSMWDYIVYEIAQSRGLMANDLQGYASRLEISTPKNAVSYGLVDSLYYRDQMSEELTRLTGRDSTDKPRVVSLSEYRYTAQKNQNRYQITVGNILSSDEIAVIYADGDIVDVGDANKQIVGNVLAKTLSKVRKDDDIKAVVLRVNSPGGSALAAEIIWREMWLTQQEKPVIVSLGNYAASGGYYISCGAEYIVTAPTTLTGSIGVFGLMFNIQKGANEHLGLTSDVVKTNAYADMGNPFRPLSPAERIFIQNGVDSVYSRFVGLVALGRSLSVDSVDLMAGGRVWTGVQALDRGLVDGTGTLRDAIRIAAEHAGFNSAENYVVEEYPSAESSSFALILESMTSSAVAKVMEEHGQLAAPAIKVRELIMNQGIKAAMPHKFEIEY